MRTWSRSLALTVTVLLGAGPLGAQEELSGLLARLPDTVNSVTVVNLESLLQSTRGAKEEWAAKYEMGYLSGAVLIPPTVRVAVLASRWQPDGKGAPTTYGLALRKSKAPLPLQELAKKEQGDLDNLAGQQVLLTRRHGFIAQLAPGVVGLLAPPDRQEFARWLRNVQTGKDGGFSPYLRDAVLGKQSAHVLMAIDLQDLIDPKALQAWLNATPVLKGVPGAPAELGKLLAGLKGVRFTARVEQTTNGQVRLDFSTAPTAKQAEIIHELFLEWLGNVGAFTEEFTGGHVHVENQSVVLETALSDASMRRIMTLIQLPSATDEADAPKPGPDVLPELVASRRYYMTIETILTDLKRSNKTKTYAQSVLWYDKYADRIDQLPIAQVDKDLVQYGATIAGHLRALAASLRGNHLEVRGLEGRKQFYVYQEPGSAYWGGAWGGLRMGMPGAGWNWGWGFSPGNVQYWDNFAEVRAKQAEAITKGASEREQVWLQIEQEGQAIRLKMQERFKVDFAVPVK